MRGSRYGLWTTREKATAFVQVQAGRRGAADCIHIQVSGEKDASSARKNGEMWMSGAGPWIIHIGILISLANPTGDPASIELHASLWKHASPVSFVHKK
jgi:hypothetical protein